jgi:hypothetical protein
LLTLLRANTTGTRRSHLTGLSLLIDRRRRTTGSLCDDARAEGDD